MKQRTITSTVFAIVMLAGVYGGRHTFFILFALITAGCLWELNGLLFIEANRRALRRSMGVALGMTPYFISGWYLLRTTVVSDAVFWTVVTVAIVIVWCLFVVEMFLADRRPYTNVAHYVLGLVYLGIPFTLLIDIALWTGDYSPNRVFGLMWLVWTNDVMAFAVGSRLGRHKLFERISPGKTWEGLIGALLCTLFMAWLLSLVLDDYTPIEWLAIGGVVSVAGPLGDLSESMLKRSLGVKDAGNFLPGHGGFLDRFDAFLYSIPVAWGILEALKNS